MAVCPSCQSQVAEGARFCPQCGSTVSQVPGADDADALLGKVIARNFRVEALLGTGGMGRVYRARQISLDKPVVLKVLHPHFQSDPQIVQRFQREARAASRLNHPNSISIIDFGQAEDGTLFMAMELLHGRDLFTLLQTEFPIATDRLARIMIQVCSALAEAHAENIIHRDLKPENIMVEDRRDQKDFVKVLDFGIAKIQDPTDEAGRALTQQGMVCGTPEYMSPEQARGESLDARSDVYALGVLMFQLVTGDLPFKAETPLGIVTKHITEAPPSPRELRPDLNIPAGVEAIILKCLEKQLELRFQTATELGVAWKMWLDSLDVTRTHAPRSGTLNALAATPAPSAMAPIASPGSAMPRTEASVPSAQGFELHSGKQAREGDDLTTSELAAMHHKPVGLIMGVAGLVLLGVAGTVYFMQGQESGPAPHVVTAPPSAPAAPAIPTAPPAKPAAPAPTPAETPAAEKNGAPAANPEPAAAPAPVDSTPAKTAAAEQPHKPAAAAKPPPDEKQAEPATARPSDEPHEKSAATRKTKSTKSQTATKNDGPADEDSGGRAEAIAELVGRAEKRMNAGDYDEAVKLLKQVRKADERNVRAAKLLGDSLAGSGDMTAACPHWRDFLRLAPKDSRAPNVRAKIAACQ